VIAVPNMSLEGVLDDYFEQRPPFSEKKKSEFPDAFAAAALEAWCKKKSEKILVISGDGDWPIICEGSDVLTYCRFQLTTFASQPLDIGRFPRSCKGPVGIGHLQGHVSGFRPGEVPP
jgi:hypothetical protein